MKASFGHARRSRPRTSRRQNTRNHFARCKKQFASRESGKPTPCSICSILRPRLGAGQLCLRTKVDTQQIPWHAIYNSGSLSLWIEPIQSIVHHPFSPHGAHGKVGLARDLAFPQVAAPDGKPGPTMPLCDIRQRGFCCSRMVAAVAPPTN